MSTIAQSSAMAVGEVGPATTAAPDSEPPVVDGAPGADRRRVAGRQPPAELLIRTAAPDLGEGVTMHVAERRPVGPHHHAAGLHVAVMGDVRRAPWPVAAGLTALGRPDAGDARLEPVPASQRGGRRQYRLDVDVAEQLLVGHPAEGL